MKPISGHALTVLEVAGLNRERDGVAVGRGVQAPLGSARGGRAARVGVDAAAAAAAADRQQAQQGAAHDGHLPTCPLAAAGDSGVCELVAAWGRGTHVSRCVQDSGRMRGCILRTAGGQALVAAR